MVKQKKIDDGSAEQKIKEAARKLFTEKGFDAVKTRDIAAEAGINLALLNYYFRSKEKLFDLIMTENFEQFVKELHPILSDEGTSLEDTISKAARSYIDMLSKNPGLPFFIMNEMRNNSSRIAFIKAKMGPVRDGFMRRIEQGMKDGKIAPVHISQFMMNFMGLVIFPFIAQPMVMKINGLSKKEFDELMEQRKELVPMWLKSIMKAK